MIHSDLDLFLRNEKGEGAVFCARGGKVVFYPVFPATKYEADEEQVKDILKWLNQAVREEGVPF